MYDKELLKNLKKITYNKFCSNEIKVICSDGTLSMKDGEFVDI